MLEPSINNQPWHFCLLARQLSANDPMTFSEGSSINQNVTNNNNIAWKNVNIVDNLVNLFAGAAFNVENLSDFNQLQTVEIALDSDQEFAGKSIKDNMIITLQENIWKRVIEDEKNLDNLKLCGDNRELIVTGLPARLSEIPLKPKESGQIFIGFKSDESLKFTEPININVIQRNGDEIVGGVTYVINPQRDNSQTEEQIDTSRFKLISTTYGKKATYNWYSQKGKLISRNSRFGYPRELNRFASETDLEGMEFVSIDEVMDLKLESSTEKKCWLIDWLFKNKNKEKIIINPKNTETPQASAGSERQVVLSEDLFKKNEYLRISFDNQLQTESVIMIFNSYSEVANNYIIGAGNSSVSVSKNSLTKGENHVYLISQNMVIGFGVIQI